MVVILVYRADWEAEVRGQSQMVGKGRELPGHSSVRGSRRPHTLVIPACPTHLLTPPPGAGFCDLQAKQAYWSPAAVADLAYRDSLRIFMTRNLWGCSRSEEAKETKARGIRAQQARSLPSARP